MESFGSSIRSFFFPFFFVQLLYHCLFELFLLICVHFPQSHISEVREYYKQLLDQERSDEVDQNFEMQMAYFGLQDSTNTCRHEDNCELDCNVQEQINIAFIEEVEEEVGDEGINDEAKPLASPYLGSFFDAQEGCEGEDDDGYRNTELAISIYLERVKRKDISLETFLKYMKKIEKFIFN